MEDKKKPPFFNDDSLAAFHYKQLFYDTMELFIETLTGTCFELRVFPFDTVISVKAKIQRLEGIPIAQQHLIWNNLELDDEYSLHDYNVAEGCTLKLVLAMRGGPINTRRVAMEEPVNGLANLMESSSRREEGSRENTLSGKPVTFLVYREGEQLNFFRVVDCEGDTLTTLSGSPSDCSLVYNVFTEEEEDGDGSVTAAGIPTLENSITMSKMKLLKAKIEDLSLNKKPKKFKKMKPQPPVDPITIGRSLVLPSMRQHHHRLLNVLPQIPLQPNGQLPPIGGKGAKSPSPAFTSTNVAHNFITRQAPSIFTVPEEELQKSGPLLAGTRPSPKISNLCVGSYELMRDNAYPQLPHFTTKEQSEEASERHHQHAVSLGLVDEAAEQMNLSQPGSMFGSLKDSSEPQNLDVSPQADGVSTGIAPLFEGVGTNSFFPLALADGTQLANTTLHIQLSSHCPSNPSTVSRPLPQPFEFTGSSLQPSNHSPRICTRALLKSSNISPHNSTSFTTPSPANVQDIKEVSLSKCPEKTTKDEERGITKIANQLSKEPRGILNNIEMALRTPRLTSRERLVPGASLGLSLAANNASGLGLLGSTTYSVPENIKLLRNNFIKRMSPLRKTAASYLPSCSLGSAGGASSLRRISTPSCYLPPIKVAVASGKKNTKICFCCGKKTGLATSYECRCGNNFCATHRYAETHNCTYDYKSVGRRFLQKTNPIISAPKLPKI